MTLFNIYAKIIVLPKSEYLTIKLNNVTPHHTGHFHFQIPTVLIRYTNFSNVHILNRFKTNFKCYFTAKNMSYHSVGRLDAVPVFDVAVVCDLT